MLHKLVTFSWQCHKDANEETADPSDVWCHWFGNHQGESGVSTMCTHFYSEMVEHTERPAFFLCTPTWGDPVLQVCIISDVCHCQLFFPVIYLISWKFKRSTERTDRSHLYWRYIFTLYSSWTWDETSTSNIYVSFKMQTISWLCARNIKLMESFFFLPPQVGENTQRLKKAFAWGMERVWSVDNQPF